MLIRLIRADRRTNKHDKADMRFARLPRACATFWGCCWYVCTDWALEASRWIVGIFFRGDAGVASESRRMVVRYCHGSDCYSVELDLDGVQDECSFRHMTHRRIVIYLGTSNSPYLIWAAAVRWLSKGVWNVSTLELRSAQRVFVVMCTCRTNNTSLFCESG